MSRNTDALQQLLALAEAAGDTEQVALLRAVWPALERRRPPAAGATWPPHRERRRRISPGLSFDDALAEAWLLGRPLPLR